MRIQKQKKHREQILWADHIVYIYPPIFWGGRPPAMLLGYIDRLFSKDFAYTYEGNSVFMKGLLKNKKVTCISTMKGPTGYLRLFLYNMNQVIMKKAVFNVVGIKDVKFFEFGSMETKKNKQEKKA